eukprot:446612-Prorocentrum_minimum.AAC.1
MALSGDADADRGAEGLHSCAQQQVAMLTIFEHAVPPTPNRSPRGAIVGARNARGGELPGYRGPV